MQKRRAGGCDHSWQLVSESPEGLISAPGRQTHSQVARPTGRWGGRQAKSEIEYIYIYELGMRISESFQSRPPKPEIRSGALLTLALDLLPQAGLNSPL